MEEEAGVLYQRRVACQASATAQSQQHPYRKDKKGSESGQHALHVEKPCNVGNAHEAIAISNQGTYSQKHKDPAAIPTSVPLKPYNPFLYHHGHILRYGLSMYLLCCHLQPIGHLPMNSKRFQSASIIRTMHCFGT
mgnify:CR=1 FL=1